MTLAPSSLQLIDTYAPQTELGRRFKAVARLLPPDIGEEIIGLISRTLVITSRLTGRILHADGSITDLGLLSEKVVTTTGVGYLVDAWQNLVELEDMRYHGFGSGTGVEGVGNIALGTEFTTQYATDNVRPTGSLTEGAGANIFRTVGTFTPDSGFPVTVEEHGIFSQAATGGGVLWDRSLTGTVTLNSGDSLEVTYDMTATAGG
jgi:hypothetical protein